jgi:Fe-S oxidoreductase
VKEALDLCLACKGCKGDCPVNVDVATYKSEFLSHYYDGHLRPASAYAFGLIDQWARMASFAPGLVNLFTQLPGLRALAKAIVGIPQARQIPAFAPETFRSWFSRRGVRNAGAEKVMLWPDTFNNFFFPETAQAAVDVLEHAGFQVELPEGHVCCGRPLYDYGMLDRAKSYLERSLRILAPAIQARTPIVVLEPSCCSVFRDELVNLLGERGDARKLAEQVVTLSEFLTSARVRATGYVPPKLARKALVQGHCHHKAIMRFDAEGALFEQIGLDLEVLQSGCCGMAGGFGYEKEKYDLSVAAGERVLLPKVRQAPARTLIVADGFSCREQISQQTERGALHLADVMKLALDPKATSEELPERETIRRRTALRKRSMKRAALAVGLVVVGVSAWTLRARVSARFRDLVG